MTTANYPVNQATFTVFPSGAGQPAQSLLNPSQTVIYVDSTPQASTSQGFPLNPNAVMPWAANTPLYVVCPSGTGTLQLVDAPAGYFDPSSLANQINLVGVPAVDTPTQILTKTQTVASGAAVVNSGIVNVAKYTSIFATFTESGAANSVNTRKITLTWYADAAATIILAVDSFSMSVFTATARIQRLVKGAYLIITSSAATTTSTVTLTWQVVGTLRTVVPRTVLTTGRNNTGGTVQAASDPNLNFLSIDNNAVPASGVAFLEYANMVCGCNATLTIRTISTITSNMGFDLLLYDGTEIFTYIIPAGTPPPALTIGQLWLPPAPIAINMINFDGSTHEMAMILTAEPG